MATPEDLFRQCVELAPDFTVYSHVAERDRLAWRGLEARSVSRDWFCMVPSDSWTLTALLRASIDALSGRADSVDRLVRSGTGKRLGQRSAEELLAEIERATRYAADIREHANTKEREAAEQLAAVRKLNDRRYARAQRLDAIVASRFLALARLFPDGSVKAGMNRNAVVVSAPSLADSWEIDDAERD